MCSFTSGACLPPYEFPIQYNDMYECLNAGYKESLKKSKEIGRKDVNENGIYIRFMCKEDTKVKVET
tara:strand:+ start:337 stop:537 length:201 start_codon:yes stop_codon:yes gene_type:complete